LRRNRLQPGRAANGRGMKANDSRECRNCHSFDGMDTEKQKLRGAKMHKIGAGRKEDLYRLPQRHCPHQKPKGMKEEDDE
jgi:cytochrome c-type protein NapC